MVNPSETCLRCHGAMPARGDHGSARALARDPLRTSNSPRSAQRVPELPRRHLPHRTASGELPATRPNIEEIGRWGSAPTAATAATAAAPGTAISYPYPRHAWPDMDEEVPEWALGSAERVRPQYALPAAHNEKDERCMKDHAPSTLKPQSLAPQLPEEQRGDGGDRPGSGRRRRSEAKAFAYEPYPTDDELETVVTSCAHNCGSRHMLVAHKKGDVIVRLSTDNGTYQGDAYGHGHRGEAAAARLPARPQLPVAALLARAAALPDETGRRARRGQVQAERHGTRR